MNVNSGNMNLGLAMGGTPMRRVMKTFLPAAVALIAVAAGCAQDIGTIDRVQLNLTKKADLLFNPDGTRKEWYVKVTVTEAPFASAWTFQGEEGTLERGVFDIQEGILYFYRVYPFVTNEWAGNPRHDVDQQLLNRDGKPYLLEGKEIWIDKNAPVLAYAIATHIDVIWEYNPNTGEKTNVRSENTTDRLWYEREYMRVTWGLNLAKSITGLLYGKKPPSGEVSSSSALNDEAVPVIHHDEESAPGQEARINPETGYIDFVDDWIAPVPIADESGYPFCFYQAWAVGGIFECVSERLRLRTSFLQVDPIREELYAKYDRQTYTDFDMERFGYFRSERLKWDVDYGTTYSNYQRYLNRHDIWQRKDDGEIVGIKPVVYHLSEGYPANLVAYSKELALQWSVAFDATVKSVTGKAPIELAAYDSTGKAIVDATGKAVPVEHMFIVCENNSADIAAHGAETAETNPAICGDLSEPKLLGDLRYNFLNSVNSPTQNGLYGYGPSAADPLSGRIVSATANNYAASMHEGARTALDQIELLTGVKSFREIANADYIADDMRIDRLQQSTYWKKGFTNDEAQRLAAKLVAPEIAASLTAQLPQKTDQNFSQARMSILAQNPDLENLFVTDDVRMLFNDPRLGVNAPKNDDPSTQPYLLRNWANSSGTRKANDKRVEFARRGYDLASFYDGALIGLANQYKVRYDQTVCSSLKGESGLALDFGAFNESDNPCTTAALIEQLRKAFAYANFLNPYEFETSYFPTPLEMSTQDPALRLTQEKFNAVLDGLRGTVSEELFKQIYYGVAIHEVGHTLGLRHNFEASSDSLNFKQKYWDLKVRKEGNTYEALGLWGETPEQAAAGMRQYQYSSVMDYYLKFNMPWEGVGLYDIAAVKYGYGSMMEVFDTPPSLESVKEYVAVDPLTIAPGNEPISLGYQRGEGLGVALRRIHATNIPNLFKDTAAIYARHDVPKSEVVGNTCDQEGILADDGKVCRKLYEGLRWTIADTVVPYRFGGDELAFRIPTVSMWDEGVDSFEIVSNLKEYYENMWIFQGYWHQNPNYWPTNYDGIVRFAFSNMRDHFQWWVLNYQTYNYNDFWKSKFGKRWEEDLNGGLPGAMAAYVSFNTMASSLGRPEPGRYALNLNSLRYEPQDQMNRENYSGPIMILEENGGRPIYSGWDYSGYLPVVTNSGSIYERIAAFQYLSDPETTFLATDNQADTRKYLINFGTVFRQEMRELFGGLMANNSDKYGWCILRHPQSPNLPFSFMPPQRVGAQNSGQDCTNTYYGCFVQAEDGSYSKKPSQILVFDDPTACPSGQVKVAIPGVSLEPEPMYVFPTTRFRIPMLAAYYGLSMLVNNYDMSFMDTTRIWLKGDKYEVTPPPGAEVTSCEDIFSGRVYMTFRMPDGQYYPAFDLVKRCDFMFSCYDPTRNDTLTAEQQSGCKSLKADWTNSLTFDDLRANYLFNDIQFLIGKLELIRAMHASYEFH